MPHCRPSTGNLIQGSARLCDLLQSESVRVPPVGAEPNAVRYCGVCGCGFPNPPAGADLVAVSADSELRRIAAVWAVLPEEARRSILSVVTELETIG